MGRRLLAELVVATNNEGVRLGDWMVYSLGPQAGHLLLLYSV
jgi:hypothetical protein